METDTREYINVLASDSKQFDTDSAFRILSYNILAQYKARTSAFPYCEQKVLKWHHRRLAILEEILSQNANIVCLQEIDNFEIWWRPKLAEAGYDCVYKKRARHHKEGVAIFYRREQFQLFGTEEIDFNKVGQYLQEEKPSDRLEQNNVGLIIRLQPWEDSNQPTALCIATAQLASPKYEDLITVQRKQLLMLLRKVEVFNSDFQLPVILCGTFSCLPNSEHYRLIIDGRFPEKLIKPFAMKRRPLACATGRSQITVSWEIDPDCGDAPLKGFIVKRRAGGQGPFIEPKYFEGGDLKAVKICGLSSSVTYEFIVAGVSAVGDGEFSQPSLPCRTVKNDLVLSVDRYLRHPTDPAVIVLGDNIETHENWVLEAEKKESNIDEDTGGTPRFEDFSPNLEVNPVRTGQKSGFRPKGLVHQLCLDSAYYVDGSEPSVTKAIEKFQGCVDYIFYSKEKLFPIDLLSTPDLQESSSANMDPRRPKNVSDNRDRKPESWETIKGFSEIDYNKGAVVQKENPSYMGEWKERELENANLNHHWLPNEKYTSDHIALCATLGFKLPVIASTWS